MADQAGSDGASPTPSAVLLQQTITQFEKVIDLERDLLSKSISKLQHDFEEASTELSMKEEELMVWEERLQQIQQDNEVKLRLAKLRAEGARWRSKGDGRRSAAERRPSPLGFIAEGDEDMGDEFDEEDMCDTQSGVGTGSESLSRPTPTRASNHAEEQAQDNQQMVGDSPHVAAAEAVNSLACIVRSELAAMQKQWQGLMLSVKDAKQLTPAPWQAKFCTQHRIDRLLNERRTELNLMKDRTNKADGPVINSNSSTPTSAAGHPHQGTSAGSNKLVPKVASDMSARSSTAVSRSSSGGVLVPRSGTDVPLEGQSRYLPGGSSQKRWNCWHTRGCQHCNTIHVSGSWRDRGWWHKCSQTTRSGYCKPFWSPNVFEFKWRFWKCMCSCSAPGEKIIKISSIMHVMCER